MNPEDDEFPNQPELPEDDPGATVDGWTTADVPADRVTSGTWLGEEFHAGAFVGGEFRTSDELPGQVTLSNESYVDGNGTTYPGIRVSPTVPHNPARPPGIGANENGMIVTGGTGTSGTRGFATLEPSLVSLRVRNQSTGPDSQIYATTDLSRMYARTGTGQEGSIWATTSNVLAETFSGDDAERGYMRILPTSAELASVTSANTYRSRLMADDTEAYLHTSVGGITRYLSVDANGIWVKVGSNAYNLEDTAQDSGWNAIDVQAPVTGGGNPAWRNRGGVIYMRGTVTYAWTGGGTWDTIATGLPASVRPQVRVHALSPDTSVNTLIFRVTTDGQLQGRRTNEGGGQTIVGELSGIQYTTG